MIRKEFTEALVRAIAFGFIAAEERSSRGEARHEAELAPGETQLIEDLALLLDARDPEETAELYRVAAGIRDAECGRRMVLRGLVEFSSCCSNDCRYCGLNRNNPNAERYRLTKDEILECAALIYKAGIRTVVLQSGEDGTPAPFLADVIRAIKEKGDMAITVSAGERQREDFALWRDAGADRYLMRVESSDPALYAALHEGRSLETRLRCLDDLQSLGYQTGSGIMVGPPGQTSAHIARDILFFSRHDFDMIGIGPFIPHPDTPYRDEPAGGVALTLNTVALTRIVTRNSWLPATTALGSLDRDYRIDALRAGANVVMPNFSPVSVKKKYAIYPGKRCLSERTGACALCMDRLAKSAGLELDYSRADSLKNAPRHPIPA